MRRALDRSPKRGLDYHSLVRAQHLNAALSQPLVRIGGSQYVARDQSLALVSIQCSMESIERRHDSAAYVIERDPEVRFHSKNTINRVPKPVRRLIRARPACVYQRSQGPARRRYARPAGGTEPRPDRWRRANSRGGAAAATARSAADAETQPAPCRRQSRPHAPRTRSRAGSGPSPDRSPIASKTTSRAAPKPEC